MRKISRGRALLPHRAVAGTGRDGDDARQAEVGPEQAGADHAVMRHDDQPVDLLVGIVGEREHRPVVAAFARAHFDAAHDAVGAGRGRNLDAVGFRFLPLGGRGEIDGGNVEPHIDGFDRARRQRRQQHGGQCKPNRCHAADHNANRNLGAKVALQQRPAISRSSAAGGCTSAMRCYSTYAAHCADFAAPVPRQAIGIYSVHD